MPRDVQEPVAVVGLGCVFPGAPDVDAFWRNIVDGVDAITEVPAGRWDPVFFDPGASAPDRFSCNRGGFVDDVATFDSTRFGIMPVAAEGAEPDQLLALSTAAAALDDTGGALDDVRRERVGVIVGRGGYLGPAVARLEQRVRTAEQLVTCLRTLMPTLDEHELAEVKAAFQHELGPARPEAAIGLVPNLAASRIANRLDLSGPAYTVDAACASSLIAIDSGVNELASGRCDLVVAGGVHHCHDLTLWSVFSQLGALSRQGTIRPFSRDADGILVGEGTGMVVLERLADAERYDHPIYAVLRGTGIASDGRDTSLMSPRVDGQVLALEQAYERAGIDPATVGLVEAHGTATPAGDQVELDTLRRVFGKDDLNLAPRALGSVKSMIGHAMPAAGAAGFIKTVLAVHHGVLPPTLHAEEPHPAVADTRFELVSHQRPWEDGDVPRRAGVNAFGFGGINAHAVLEQHAASRRRRYTSGSHGTAAGASRREGERVLLLQGRDLTELGRQLADLRDAGAFADGATDRLVTGPGEGPARLAIVAPNEKRLDLAARLLTKGVAWRGRNDVWIEPEPMVAAGGTVAFLFPGVEPIFEPRVDDVAEHFDRLLPEPPESAGPLEAQGRGIVALGRLLDDTLGDLGIRPDHVAGHSVGEWTGFITSELIPADQVEAFIDTLEPGRLEVPGVEYVMLGCGANRARELLAGRPGAAVSHDNCPHQSIVCGTTAAVEALLPDLAAAKVVAQVLPFRSGFHSPMFEPYLDAMRAHWDRMPVQPTRVPLWSATTTERFPDDPAEVRDLAAEHLLQPVRFRALIERLHDEGVRLFVQVGVGSLTGFVDDTLRDREFLSITASSPKRDGLEQLLRVAAASWAEGVAVDFEPLLGPVVPAAAPPSGRATPLSLGVPLVHLPPELILSAAPARSVVTDGSPVAAAHAAVLDQLESSAADVLAAWRAPAPVAQPTIAPVSRTLRLSVDEHPWLADHCFYRQPDGWTDMEDRFPVVPMTTMLELMAEVACEAVPGRVVTAIEDIRAYRWLQVAPPAEVVVDAKPDETGRKVRVSLGSFARATICLGDGWPPAPAPEPLTLTGVRPSPQSAAELYEQHYMFHGPAFQGVREITELGDLGITGVLEAPAAPGALLDNAGQVYGYWVMATAEVNFLALPSSIDRVEHFGPLPNGGERVETSVRITELTDRTVTADLDLVHDGRVIVRITGWTDRRFDSDEALWTTLREPEHHLLADLDEAGVALVEERWPDSASRELMMRRYLGGTERPVYDSLHPRAQRHWLLGRIAAKDAVKAVLQDRGEPATFPIEVTLSNDDAGQPLVHCAYADDLRVSIAHCDWIGVAMVGQGQAVGVDIELIEPRSDRFGSLTLTDREAELVPSTDRDRWLTRCWAAKEAAAKATGHGLEGRPKAFEIETIDIVDDDHARLRVGDRWIATRIHRVAGRPPTDVEPGGPSAPVTKEYIVAWTEPFPHDDDRRPRD